MYQYEDRTRVVWLFIKLGKSTGATFLLLGCPTKNQKLASRARARSRFLAGYVRSRSKYSDEQNRVDVEH